MDVRKEQSTCTYSHAPNYTFQANDNGKLTDSNHPGLSIAAIQIQIWASLFCFFDHENIKVNPRSPFDLLPSHFELYLALSATTWRLHKFTPFMPQVRSTRQSALSRHYADIRLMAILPYFTPDSLPRHSSIKPHFNVVRHINIAIDIQ